MKLFKVTTLVIVFWFLIGLMCMLFNVTFEPYGVYWFYTGLVLAGLQEFALFRMIFFDKK